jgi:lysophospholipase L1-like esterase
MQCNPLIRELLFYEFNTERISTYNDAYKIIAKELNVPYLDVFNHLKNKYIWQTSQAKNDGIHPMHDGYQELARFINSWQIFHEFMRFK